MISSETQTIEV